MSGVEHTWRKRRVSLELASGHKPAPITVAGGRRWITLSSLALLFLGESSFCNYLVFSKTFIPVVLGGYSADHPVIKVFWRVVEGFTDEEKRKLLKFVTSCSRPPLLGFKVRASVPCALSSNL